MLCSNSETIGLGASRRIVSLRDRFPEISIKTQQLTTPAWLSNSTLTTKPAIFATSYSVPKKTRRVLIGAYLKADMVKDSPSSRLDA